jgi:hypothetical protein
MRLYHKIAAMAASVFLLASVVNAAMPANYTGKIFSAAPLNGVPQQIPGLVETPYFDEGGLDTTWHYAGNNLGDCFIRANHGGTNVSLQWYGDYKDFVSRADVRLVDSMCYPVNTHAHLGWIQTAPNATSRGEWETYTVHVNTAGSYKMIFHESVVAVPNLILVTFSGLPTDSVKDQPLSIRPPADHENYHDWKYDTTATKLQLDTGLYVITLEFITGGWNFHAMKFVLDASSTISATKQGLMNNGFELMPVIIQNNLSVSYSLAQAGRTTVSVYDCAGRAMVPSISRNMNAGAQKQIVGIGNMGRGVYFVRVEQNGLRETKSFTITR